MQSRAKARQNTILLKPPPPRTTARRRSGASWWMIATYACTSSVIDTVGMLLGTSLDARQGKRNLRCQWSPCEHRLLWWRIGFLRTQATPAPELAGMQHRELINRAVLSATSFMTLTYPVPCSVRRSLLVANAAKTLLLLPTHSFVSCTVPWEINPPVKLQ